MSNSKAKLSERMALAVDAAVRILSPAWAYRRAAFRAGYEILDRHRTRPRPATYAAGTADSALDAATLTDLAEYSRTYERNNPTYDGALATALDKTFGDEVKIQARTGDESWNETAEGLWRERMVEEPVDSTGRFNIHTANGLAYLSYLRDGDFFQILHSDTIQLVEREQVGTPFGISDKKHFKVVNGIAYARASGKLIGYYVGKPHKSGFYIAHDSYKKYSADRVHHWFSPKRSSQSRGVPALASAFKNIQYLEKYLDAELVAACVNACFTMAVTYRDPNKIPDAFTGGVAPTGRDSTTRSRHEGIEQGKIMYFEPGEEVKGVGMERPGAQFDTFVKRITATHGMPLGIPLMLLSGDYSHATFMNTRVAMQQAQERWRREQSWVIVPAVRKQWRWFVDRMITDGDLKERDDQYRCEIQPKRWGYVDPYKEAMADKVQLANGTTNRKIIDGRAGYDYGEVAAQLAKEEAERKEAGLAGPAEKVPKGK